MRAHQCASFRRFSMKKASSLVSVNVKIEAEKRQLADLKEINLSKLCREALDTRLRLVGDDSQMLKEQLINNEKQIQILTLENKLILSLLETLESKDAINEYRDAKYEQWKVNLAYMVTHKTIDWRTQKELFKFPNMEDCKKWLLAKLENEGLI